MLTILQKIKDLVSTQTVKLAQHEAKDGSILDIDKLEPGVTFRSAIFTELEKIKNNINVFLQHKDV